MDEGWDVVAAVERGLRDRAHAWRFIRDFAAHWATPIVDGGGKELGEAEERLGIRLPAAVREGYELLDGRPDLTSNQDHLAKPAELDFEGDALVYRWENQSVVSWGILRPDLDSPDPPTWMCEVGETVWHPRRDEEALDVVRQALAVDWLMS